jgi:uncharacterized protein (TIGR00156 family)
MHTILSFRPLIALAAGTGLLAIGATATAQYSGPSNTPVYKTIAEVLKHGSDETPVQLEGHLVKKVGKEKYLFSDGSSEIRVEIDDKHFPATAVNEKTRVQIRGEFEKDFLQSPEIDVDQLAVLTKPAG